MGGVAVQDHAQGQLFPPRIHLTRPAAAHRRCIQLSERIERSLRHFPELHGTRLTVGVTRVADGIAVLEDMTVRFDLRRGPPSYYVIGHELTHLLQALGGVPSGEVQCDIWTLARGPLFLDEAPCYLRLPDKIRAGWGRYRRRVSYLCARAISERSTRRYYIRWLGQQLGRLEAGSQERVRVMGGAAKGADARRVDASSKSVFVAIEPSHRLVER